MSSHSQEDDWNVVVENTDPRIEYFGSETNETVSVFIGNLPSGLDEGGLWNLLMACAGKPVDIRFIKDDSGRRLAFADFTTIKAVTKVIQDLNNKPPLYLRIEVSKKKQSSGRPGRIEDMSPTFAPQLNRPPSDYQPPATWAVGRGAGVRRSTSVHRAYRAHMQTRIIRDASMWSTGPADVYDADGFMYVPRNPHEEVNLETMSSLQMTTRSDGRRIITMGRGYYVYPKKRPIKSNSPGSSQNKQFFQNVSTGVYSYNNDIEAPAVPCLCCKVRTVKKCSECGASYCSEECQGRDWDRHKTNCRLKLCIDVIPDNVHGDRRSITLRPLSDPITIDVPTHTEVPTSSRARSSVIDVMRENMQLDGVYEISKCSPKSKAVYGTLCCSAGSDALTMLLANLPILFENSSATPGFSPEKGSMVVLCNQKSWWRGTVITAPSQNFDEYRVGMTDLAKIVTVKRNDLRPLPPAYANVPEFGIKGTVVTSHVQENDLWTKYLRVGNDIHVHVESAEGSSITCSIKSDDKENICQMQFQRWDPEAQLKENRVVSLSIGCRVVLTCYHNQHALFVRPTGKQHVELRNTVLQQVAASHVLGSPLNRPPRRDEMVACKCLQDGSYYRAIVREASFDNAGKYKVWFVDFGNIADVGIEDMRILPEDVKNYPFLAVKVGLKNVCDHKLTPSAAQFLNELLDKEEVMTLAFQNGIEEGVDLVTRDGTSVNRKLTSFLQPSWKISLPNGASVYDDKVYMLEDLISLPLIEDGKDEVGEMTVIVLHVDAAKGIILCCPATSPVVPAVVTSLNAQINEFCDSPVSNVSYNPRKHEICLARHQDGSWHRALSVESIEGGSRVLFLDLGGTQNVLFRDIRRILPDFMDMPTLISSCQIQGLPAKLTGDLKDKLQKLIKPDSTIKVQNVKVVERGSNEYLIELPEVLSTLRSQELLSC